MANGLQNFFRDASLATVMALGADPAAAQNAPLPAAAMDIITDVGVKAYGPNIQIAEYNGDKDYQTKHSIVPKETDRSIPVVEAGDGHAKIELMRYWGDLMTGEYEQVSYSVTKSPEFKNEDIMEYDLRAKTDNRFSSLIDHTSFTADGYLTGGGGVTTAAVIKESNILGTPILFPRQSVSGRFGGGDNEGIFKIDRDEEAGLCNFEIDTRAIQYFETQQSLLDQSNGKGIELQGYKLGPNHVIDKSSLNGQFQEAVMAVPRVDMPFDKPENIRVEQDCNFKDLSIAEPRPLLARNGLRP